MSTSYATIQEAEEYFSTRLHESAWSLASANDRLPALIAATRIIDSLSFKGFKNSVYAYRLANPTIATLADQGDSASLALIRVEEASQELEFPRGTDTTVPSKILWACYEIAYALLDGVDPEIELENMSMNDHGIASVRASFNRNQEPLEHFMNGVPSATAWKYLKPFLRDDRRVRLTRVS